jgi:hypothetical protein
MRVRWEGHVARMGEERNVCNVLAGKSEGKDPGTHCTGGWLGLRIGQDTEARGEILSPLTGFEPRSLGRPTRSQTLY